MVYVEAAFSVLDATTSVAWICAVVVPTEPLGGVTSLNEVGVRFVIGIEDPLKVAVVSRPKSVPSTVTVWPPTTGPYAGFSEVMTGGATVSWAMSLPQHSLYTYL